MVRYTGSAAHKRHGGRGGPTFTPSEGHNYLQLSCCAGILTHPPTKSLPHCSSTSVLCFFLGTLNPASTRSFLWHTICLLFVSAVQVWCHPQDCTGDAAHTECPGAGARSGGGRHQGGQRRHLSTWQAGMCAGVVCICEGWVSKHFRHAHAFASSFKTQNERCHKAPSVSSPILFCVSDSGRYVSMSVDYKVCAIAHARLINCLACILFAAQVVCALQTHQPALAAAAGSVGTGTPAAEVPMLRFKVRIRLSHDLGHAFQRLEDYQRTRQA
jgi:hypothetical protein